ncbi:streptophobe family protein [Streptomyces sp. CA-249302]|uniref:streptophobe family protein n=1 Tax=Streptomyces sp. CA-249302 TaxID=3240058 RepID=UPI003D93299C
MSASSGVGSVSRGSRVPWGDVLLSAIASVSWALIGMAGTAALALHLLEADSAGSLGPMTAAAVALAAGGSVTPSGDVSAFGLKGAEAHTAVTITPLGVSLVGALLLAWFFLRSLRAAGVVIEPAELLARAGAVVALFVATLGGLAWAGHDVITIDGASLGLDKLPGAGGGGGGVDIPGLGDLGDIGGLLPDNIGNLIDAKAAVGFTVDTAPTLLGGLAWSAGILLIALLASRRTPLPHGWEAVHRVVRPAASALVTVLLVAVAAGLAAAAYAAIGDDHPKRIFGAALLGAPNGTWLGIPIGLFVPYDGKATGALTKLLPDPLDDLLTAKTNQSVTLSRLADLDGRVWLLAVAAALMMLLAGVLTAVRTPVGSGGGWAVGGTAAGGTAAGSGTSAGQGEHGSGAGWGPGAGGGGGLAGPAGAGGWAGSAAGGGQGWSGGAAGAGGSGGGPAWGGGGAEGGGSGSTGAGGARGPGALGFAGRCALRLGVVTALTLPLLAWLTEVSVDASLSVLGFDAFGAGIQLHGNLGMALLLGALWGAGAGGVGGLLAWATGAAGRRAAPLALAAGAGAGAAQGVGAGQPQYARESGVPVREAGTYEGDTSGPYTPSTSYRPPNPSTNPYLQLPYELREPEDARPPDGGRAGGGTPSGGGRAGGGRPPGRGQAGEGVPPGSGWADTGQPPGTGRAGDGTAPGRGWTGAGTGRAGDGTAPSGGWTGASEPPPGAGWAGQPPGAGRAGRPPGESPSAGRAGQSPGESPSAGRAGQSPGESPSAGRAGQSPGAGRAGQGPPPGAPWAGNAPAPGAARPGEGSPSHRRGRLFGKAGPAGEAGQLGGTGQSDAAGRSDMSGRPDATGRSGATGRPDAAGQSDAAGRSEATGRFGRWARSRGQEGREPDEASSPDAGSTDMYGAPTKARPFDGPPPRSPRQPPRPRRGYRPRNEPPPPPQPPPPPRRPEDDE